MKAYRVTYSITMPEIKEFEIQEFGIYYVVLNNKRQRIKTQHDAWFETMEEAKECLLNYAQMGVMNNERYLEFAKKGLENVEQYVKNLQA